MRTINGNERPVTTPWGTAQHVTHITPGMTVYSTASHGGFHLDAHLNRQVPDYMRNGDGWYEEDCEASIIVCVFPQFFTQRELENATKSLKHWYPDSAERFFNITLKPGESLIKDRMEFFTKHQGEYITVSAIRDANNEDYVRVTAAPHIMIGGQWRPETRLERTFLVHHLEYSQARTPGHYFLIDLRRHLPVHPDNTTAH